MKTSILPSLPDTPTRRQQELDLRLALGPALIVPHGQAPAEVDRAYTRAHALRPQGGTPEQRFMVLRGQWISNASLGKFRTALALGEQLLPLAQRAQNAVFLLEAHRTVAPTHFFLGEFTAARAHAEHGLALYDPQQHASLALRYGQDPGVACLAFAAWALWHLGYPDQALSKSREAVSLARELSHPYSLVLPLCFMTVVHQLRCEVPATTPASSWRRSTAGVDTVDLQAAKALPEAVG